MHFAACSPTGPKARFQFNRVRASFEALATGGGWTFLALRERWSRQVARKAGKESSGPITVTGVIHSHGWRRFALVFTAPVANRPRERARFARDPLGNPPQWATGCLYTTRMNDSACTSPWRLSVAPMMDWTDEVT